MYLIWDMDDDPIGNVRHIAEHGLDKEDIESVVETADRFEVSRSSGNLILFGATLTGRRAAVVYVQVDHDFIYPITAFFTED